MCFTTKHKFQMTTFQETLETPNSATKNESLPLVYNHRSPSFNFSLNQWLETKFQLVEPDHPEFSTLSETVRALVVVGPTPLTAETLDKLPGVEIVVCSSAGVNHIDLAECHRRGIKVTNAGDAFSEDVADYAVGLLVDVLRRVSAADRFVRDGLWPVKGVYPLGSKVNMSLSDHLFINTHGIQLSIHIL